MTEHQMWVEAFEKIFQLRYNEILTPAQNLVRIFNECKIFYGCPNCDCTDCWPVNDN